MQGVRPQPRRTHVVGDAAQLVAALARRGDVAGGEHDLDIRGE
jgi:hypothetical protein